MHQKYIMPCLECNMLELLFATMMRNSGSDYESMLQYRLHFIRNQNGQGSSLAFLNPLQIHEGLRLKLKVRTTYLFLVKGCLILEGVFTCVKSVRNHSPSTFQLRFIWTFARSNKVVKVHIFWEGHKILRNLHLTFVLCSASQKSGGDFANFCSLLRIYKLYLPNCWLED